jgi:hypothetical protein
MTFSDGYFYPISEYCTVKIKGVKLAILALNIHKNCVQKHIIEDLIRAIAVFSDHHMALSASEQSRLV